MLIYPVAWIFQCFEAQSLREVLNMYIILQPISKVKIAVADEVKEAIQQLFLKRRLGMRSF